MDDLVSIGSPIIMPHISHNDSDNFDDPSTFSPSRAPSQQKIQSNVNEMLKKVPKNNIVNMEQDVLKLKQELQMYNDAEIEAKRTKIKEELDNLRLIELMEKLSEYLLN
eukprot:748487_1